jgi:hypothetical protein
MALFEIAFFLPTPGYTMDKQERIARNVSALSAALTFLFLCFLYFHFDTWTDEHQRMILLPILVCSCEIWLDNAPLPKSLMLLNQLLFILGRLPSLLVYACIEGWIMVALGAGIASIGIIGLIDRALLLWMLPSVFLPPLFGFSYLVCLPTIIMIDETRTSKVRAMFAIGGALLFAFVA